MKFELITEYPDNQYTIMCANTFKDGKILLSEFSDVPMNKDLDFAAEITFIENAGTSSQRIKMKYATWAFNEHTSYNIQQTIKDYAHSDTKIIRINCKRFRPTQIWLVALITSEKARTSFPSWWHVVADYKVLYKD